MISRKKTKQQQQQRRICNRLRPPRTRKEALGYRRCGYGFLFIGVIFLIIGIVVPISLRNHLEVELRGSSVLDSEESLGWKIWSDNEEFPIRTEVFVHDIVNPREILEDGALPVVIEKGPYVYDYYKKVFNYSWNDDRSLLRYRNHEYYKFRPDLSVGPETESFLTYNIVFQVMRAKLGQEEGPLALLPLIYETIVPTPMTERLFRRTRVEEILFGYPDPVLEYAQTLDPSIDPRYPGILGNQTWEESLEKALWYEIHTGKDDDSQIRQFQRIDNRTSWHVCEEPPCPPNPSEPIWATEEASRIRGGGDGSHFQPGLSKSDVLKFWDSTVLRVVDLEFVRETDVKGIRCFRYEVPEHFMESAVTNPRNADYYHFLVDGVYNISALSLGAPFFAMKPHFDGVGKEVRDTVRAGWPKIDTSSFFEIEPISGASMRIVGQTQLGMSLSPLPGIPAENGTVTWFENVTLSYPSIAYFKQSVEISEEDAKEFVRLVYGAVFLMDLSLIAGLVLGILLTLWSFWMIWFGRRQMYRLPTSLHRSRSDETSPLFDDDGMSPRVDGVTRGKRKDDIDLTYADPVEVLAPEEGEVEEGSDIVIVDEP